MAAIVCDKGGHIEGVRNINRAPFVVVRTRVVEQGSQLLGTQSQPC